MAFNSILRSKSSTFIRAFSSATQLIRKTQPGHRAVLSAAVNRHEGSFVPTFHFSSEAVKNEPNSDETLLRLIESKITSEAGEEVPSNFPFKIVDVSANDQITLKRTYQGEVIQVEVFYPGERATRSSNPLLVLSVSVSKNHGTSLKFYGDAYRDEIVIQSLLIENPDEQFPYDGSYFQNLDEDEALQKSFLKYLEIRGIKPSTTNFLHKYMINMRIGPYLVWLNKLKNFIKA